MEQSPSSAVREARKTLGRRLREIRIEAGFTTARVFAARAGWSESKASRIENGVTAPSDNDLRRYADLCSVPDAYEDLVATAHNIEELYVEWRRVTGRGLAHVQQSRVPLYESTRHFRVYEPGLIPGLLQTADYARAIMTRVVAAKGIVDDVEAAVAARMERQRVLRDTTRRFGILVEEAALRSRVGAADVMAGQLGHLLQAAALPHVSVGVIPMVAERVVWPLENFWIFDDKLVSVELFTAVVTVKQPREIADYTRMFGHLAKMAWHGREARSLIADAINALG